MFLGNGKNAGEFTGTILVLPIVLVAFIGKILFRVAKKMICKAVAKKDNGKRGSK